MKNFFALLMLTSISSFASTITMQPGSSITVYADTTTTVACQGSGSQSGGSGKTACYCINNGSYSYESIMTLDGKNISLGFSISRSDCLKILNETPACK